MSLQIKRLCSLRDVMGIGIRVAFTQSSGSETGERRDAMLDRTTNRRSTAQPVFSDQRGTRFLLEIEAWIPSELRFITPVIDRIVRLVEESRCAVSNEDALSNRGWQVGLQRVVSEIKKEESHNLSPAS